MARERERERERERKTWEMKIARAWMGVELKWVTEKRQCRSIPFFFFFKKKREERESYTWREMMRRRRREVQRKQGMGRLVFGLLLLFTSDLFFKPRRNRNPQCSICENRIQYCEDERKKSSRVVIMNGSRLLFLFVFFFTSDLFYKLAKSATHNPQRPNGAAKSANGN